MSIFALGRIETICLKALLKLGEDDGGDRFVHEPEEVSILTGLDEFEQVKPALRYLSELALCEQHDAPAMPLRYRVLREAAAQALGLDPDAAVVLPPGPRGRLSALAAS